MAVVKTKAFSTVESVNFNSSVTTEFQWEVHSLGAMLKASLHKVFPIGFKGLASPRFKIEGTKGSASLWIEGNIALRGEAYKISISSDIPIEGELSILCGGKEQTAKALLPEGERTGTLCVIKADSELHAAMESSAKLCVTIRLKPLPRNKVIDTVMTESVEATAPLSISEVLREALTADHLQDLADVELASVDGETFRAHRQLLALRSPVFRATFYCGMRESQTKQANVQASGSAVKGLLECIYTDEVDTDISAVCAGELLDLGMQYQLPRLVTLMTKYLLETVSVDNVAERLQLSIRYDLSKLQEEATRLVKRNLSAVMASAGWSSISCNAEVMKFLLGHANPDPPRSSRMLEVKQLLESVRKRARLN